MHKNASLFKTHFFMVESTQNLTIKYWAEEDRPREKLILKGKNSLSDAELLAIIIGSGNREISAVGLCRNILASCNQDLEKLGKMTIADLMQFNGIGEAKAIGIIAALELGKRRQHLPAKEIFRIKNSKDIYQVMLPIFQDLYHEEFWILTLNRSNTIIRKIKLSSGGVVGTVVDPRIIFNHALQDTATSIVLAHNHPSGNKTPSDADIEITKKIKEGAEILDIVLIDHLIIINNDYFSFADESII